MDLKQIKGIGEKTEGLFAKAGITTVEELLAFYPKHYLSYGEECLVSEVKPETTVSVAGELVKPLDVLYVKRMQMTRGKIRDRMGGVMNVTWFHMPYLRNTLLPGREYVFHGKAKRSGTGLSLTQPEVYTPESYAAKKSGMQPVYPAIKGVTNAMLMKSMMLALEKADLMAEFLPLSVRREYRLAEYNFAIKQVHFPDDMHFYLQARNRLVFNEFFLFITALQDMKDSNEKAVNTCPIHRCRETEELAASLPYELTAAQKRVWEKIQEDLEGPTLMNRLIQGDVGSGKTIIAVLALLQAAANGYQGAIMAPTEVLAEQHFASFQKLLPEIPMILLTGSMTAKQKREAYARIEEGDVKIVIGTHALIQEKVVYQNLALVITDEQHRFGVRQRETLSEKGRNPHILVMSATPIPRTLAIILYGDLDISVIDELPANRLPIKNCVVNEGYRPNAYLFIKREIEKGHQAYVICPMVEESEGIEAENVIEYCEKIRKVMPPSFCVEYLHGKMRPKEKNEIMRRFASGEIQILVSTTVVEVGVNVPNATVMMVEDAERFGLAALHQLRGRVGRGKDQSYCIFVSGTDRKEAMEKLKVLSKSNDGFVIAREDLRLRGPGDLFGVRQSGDFAFAIGDIFTDAGVLEQAADAAKRYREGTLVCTEKERIRLEERVASYTQRCLENVNL